jgi:hypothetical protein
MYVGMHVCTDIAGGCRYTEGVRKFDFDAGMAPYPTVSMCLFVCLCVCVCADVCG